MDYVFTTYTVGLTPYLIKCEISSKKHIKFKLSFIGASFTFGSNFLKKFLAICDILDIPLPNEEFVINLVPSDLKKDSSSMDLAVAILILKRLGILSSKFKTIFKNSIILGELSINGNVIPVKNVISSALYMNAFKIKSLIVPTLNKNECECITKGSFYSISNIEELLINQALNKIEYTPLSKEKSISLDFDDVHGNDTAKRALMICAAGKHNVILCGPPGCGKSMLSKRVPAILPSLSSEEALEVARIYSSAGLLNHQTLNSTPPFRSPHHSITKAGLLGGGTGSTLYPGEVTLSHRGILFLDEFSEFSKRSIEGLRECLEEKKINIKRGDGAETFPTSFILIAALNPCPCGFFGQKGNKCRCSFSQIRYYLSKLSGPLLDRIDLQLFMQGVNLQEIKQNKPLLSSNEIKDRIKLAIEMQIKRNGINIYNNDVPSSQIKDLFNIDQSAQCFLDSLYEDGQLSLRRYYKILRISRTIADLDGSPTLKYTHIFETLSYQAIDKLFSQFQVS